MGRLVAVVIFVLLSINLGSAFAQSIAKVAATSGSASASGPGGNRALAVNSDIFEHDKITVGSGNAQILFVDGTRLVVGPGSTLLIEKFLMRGGSTASNFSVNALRGTFRFITGNSAKGAYKIKTANATIGIRGTAFDFWVKKKTGVAVLKGKVKLCNQLKDHCVELNAGCEMGVVEPSKSQVLKGFLKGQNIIGNLPYLIDQSSLRSSFRLDTQGCARAIQLATPKEESSKPAPPEAPPPPKGRDVINCNDNPDCR